MIAPIDFSRVQEALAVRHGWIELAVAALCIVLAWLIDRRFEQSQAARGDAARLPGSVVRLAFPLIALALTFVLTAAWRRYAGPPFFLAIAMPLLIALAAIRMLVYGLRRLFPSQSWLPASEVAIGSTVWGLVFLYFTGVLPEIASTLDDVVIPIGKAQVSVLTIFKGIAVVIVTVVATLWISGMLEQRLTRATQLDANLRVVLSKVIRALLIVIGVLFALEQIGFDLTLLTVFGGALGVGIGLGLQKLASNYIAGFTILLDRSIRLADMVTVDGRTGIVSKVTSRYVVVRSLDGVEAIVPNETLVTTTVLNHSYTSREIRIAVQVQVAYDSDVETALALLTEIALREPRVLRGERAPAAFLVSFAESGVLLELGMWIDDPHNGQLNLKSSVNRAIFAEFKARGIRIPSPQRDVRIVGQVPGPNAAPSPVPAPDAPS